MLVELSSEVEAMGSALCRDPQVVGKHMDTLQQIDLIAQQLRGLGDLLEPECPINAAQKLGLDSLRARFHHLTVHG